MLRYIRFSLDREARPTVPDSDSNVNYGLLEEDMVLEIQGLGGNRTGRSFEHPRSVCCRPAVRRRLSASGATTSITRKSWGTRYRKSPSSS